MLNKPPHIVRKERQDRRVLRTRQALSAALVELLSAANFEEITVQQVLDRAGVGRATFYTHFRNKNDLLLSDAERYFGLLERDFLANSSSSTRIAPVAELFDHVAQFDQFRRAVERSPLGETVYDLLVGHLARIIRQRMLQLEATPLDPVFPPAAMARIFAAAVVELMRWWLSQPQRAHARDMDARFHALVWLGISGPPRAPR